MGLLAAACELISFCQAATNSCMQRPSLPIQGGLLTFPVKQISVHAYRHTTHVYNTTVWSAYSKLGMWFSSAAAASVSILAGKWKPSQTDVNGMVNSTIAETGGTPCILCDMGAFHLAEFANTLCRPFIGSAVHGAPDSVQASFTNVAFTMQSLNSSPPRNGKSCRLRYVDLMAWQNKRNGF